MSSALQLNPVVVGDVLTALSKAHTIAKVVDATLYVRSLDQKICVAVSPDSNVTDLGKIWMLEVKILDLKDNLTTPPGK